MKISVITANYNYAQYIEETINSIINQTFSDWELIIVDDGSSDNSIEIIKSYCQKDSRIKLFQHDLGQNKGLKETLLLGLEHATGEWIAFLESDDFFAPDNLSKKIDIIQKYPETKLIFNKVKFLADDSRKKQVKSFENIQKKISQMDFPKNMFHDFFIYNTILTFSCVMVEANAIKDADFNTPVDSLLDWWLWIHVAQKNDFYYLDEELTSWRLHQKSYIKECKKPAFHLTQVRAYWDIYKNNKDAGHKNVRLLFFILISSIKLFFVLCFRFLRKLGGKVKQLPSSRTAEPY